MNKFIFHIDINAFFATVEEILEPSYSTQPIAVCARANQFGIISCPNYLARNYGVKSAMNKIEAKRLCPNLVFVLGHFDQYEKYSNQFFHFLKTHYGKKIQIMSIDECYLDVTNRVKTINQALALAKEIQIEIFNHLKLKINIGVSDNKFVAKMASNLHKPMGIVSCFGTDNFQKIFWPKPIKDFYFIGIKTTPLLHKLGIKTIGDFAQYPQPDNLQKIFLNQYETFMANAWGYGDDFVDARHYGYKSISASRTLDEATTNYEILKEYILKLLSSCYEKLETTNNLIPHNIKMDFRFADETKQGFTLKNLTTKLDSFDKIVFYLFKLFEKEYRSDEPVKFIAIYFRTLKPNLPDHNLLNPHQDSRKEEQEKIKKIIFDILN
ncbi:DNA polymerase-4 [Mycoplasmoides fastidiosum]|uniref:DNA polymerase-4 n=1 Tax=Mycoplasmoides fastidiosum TaxID=92758 RepID=A0ABU0M058_9BACT|nr:DNA polymerase IV [Mycoplasmoides fastidiosum]MDQ0514344.1 DNA polymerase-4 [Mycoplasmoides fastidiosum]UUD38054.1 DNA polymerase IV [Mycoplasmoides fastidiosum]